MSAPETASGYWPSRWPGEDGPTSLELVERSADLPGAKTWPGGLAAACDRRLQVCDQRGDPGPRITTPADGPLLLVDPKTRAGDGTATVGAPGSGHADVPNLVNEAVAPAGRCPMYQPAKPATGAVVGSVTEPPWAGSPQWGAGVESRQTLKSNFVPRTRAQSRHGSSAPKPLGSRNVDSRSNQPI